MITLKKGAVAGVMLLSGPLAATSAQAQDTATATATATILQSTSITNTQNLDFGTIVPSGAAATVIVTPGTNTVAATRVCGVGLTCSGSFTRAKFDVTGSHTALVLVTGDTNVTITNGSGATMNAALTYNAASFTLVRLLPTSMPSESIYVGGVLTVNANQAAGFYTGVFSVTVNYN